MWYNDIVKTNKKKIYGIQKTAGRDKEGEMAGGAV